MSLNNDIDDNELPFKDDPEVKKHLRYVKKQLRKNLISAYKGWWQWVKIRHTKGCGNTAVILLPTNDRYISHLALRYLDQLLEARKWENAIILSDDPLVSDVASLFSNRILKVIKFDRKKAENLMRFYSLYDFNEQFICASLDEPYGRNASRIVGKRGTTIEEIFVIGVYRLYPYVRPEKPIYYGKKEIEEYVNILDA